MIPVLYITGGLHPDHDSINTFRRRFLEQLSPLFVEILEYACGLGIFNLGDISIDGVKIKANASKHKAMSWDYACQLEEQLQQEVATMECQSRKGEWPRRERYRYSPRIAKAASTSVQDQ
jgi:hypothetical protein